MARLKNAWNSVKILDFLRFFGMVFVPRKQRGIVMSYSFSQIIEKLNIEKPELYFTPDENGGGDRHVLYGFYEIKNSCFGPVMFRFYEGSFADGGPVSVIAVRIKNSNFEDREYGRPYNKNFYATLNFLQKASKENLNIAPKMAADNWNKFLLKPNPNSKLDVRPRMPALLSFDAIMKVLDVRRPYELDDFVPESSICVVDDGKLCGCAGAVEKSRATE